MKIIGVAQELARRRRDSKVKIKGFLHLGKSLVKFFPSESGQARITNSGQTLEQFNYRSTIWGVPLFVMFSLPSVGKMQVRKFRGNVRTKNIINNTRLPQLANKIITKYHEWGDAQDPRVYQTEEILSFQG